mmetsp:Transcript_31926/g.105899  ORF Transcript_31926/g.105899 Transcript_31926/m.105899 type:complete len:206 (-) Transcript_31926:154-771(-)
MACLAADPAAPERGAVGPRRRSAGARARGVRGDGSEEEGRQRRVGPQRPQRPLRRRPALRRGAARLGQERHQVGERAGQEHPRLLLWTLQRAPHRGTRRAVSRRGPRRVLGHARRLLRRAAARAEGALSHGLLGHGSESVHPHDTPPRHGSSAGQLQPALQDPGRLAQIPIRRRGGSDLRGRFRARDRTWGCRPTGRVPQLHLRE